MDHFPWESLYRGPVGIHRSPLNLGRQRRAGNSNIESPTDNKTERKGGGKNDAGSGDTPSGSQRRVLSETGKNARTRERRTDTAQNEEDTRIVTDPITGEE